LAHEIACKNLPVALSILEKSHMLFKNAEEIQDQIFV